MRRRQLVSPYILLGIFLFSWVSLPTSVADEMRSFSVASLSPAWSGAKGVRKYLSNRPDKLWGEKKPQDGDRLSQLELENAQLKAQLEKISKWMVEEERVEKLFSRLTELEAKKNQGKDPQKRSFLERRLGYLTSLIQLELIAMPSEVIYRDPSSWSSSLWINVGDADNQALGKTIIAKNSPVVSGLSLVGVVDYVGEKQSRVRLITDSGLSPSVRSVRRGAQNREVVSLIGELLQRLDGREGKQTLIGDLKAWQKELEVVSEEYYLAKGEIHGSGAPLWRSRSPSLKGMGFNFDFPDEEGSSGSQVPILKKGDLLVTTGLDGVFPSDLQVGVVTRVDPPKSGGYVYEIDVRPTFENFNDLETLFVLPPRGD